MILLAQMFHKWEFILIYVNQLSDSENLCHITIHNILLHIKIIKY